MLPVAVEGDAADRGPGLSQDAVLDIQGLHLLLREIGVDLDLIDRRNHACPVEQGGEVVDHEIADPDGPDLPVGQQGLQGTVGLQGRLEVRRQRLMQDQQVNLVDPQLAGALLETVQCLVIAVVADPDLGLQKHRRAVHA